MLIKQANEVDLPEPVGPVKRTRPFRNLVKSRNFSGNLNSSIVGILVGIIRNAAPIQPLCL